ncbi:hypothetical protein KO488_00460 [Poseidonibacter lekithochrous]|uniref:hypothetical protein n=1 Tax=Poseidonibacter TaxID=2321187 RepID=UPI001C092AC5|nr:MULTISPECIES: hypothetical protein [Poseidonibacter]MBU3013212.1 hypothetical protein [Poseidonibacter lekithochrous]MDO6826508.1 hypothetical protein [Poseidonibacter sp. 1_MG-2023]
MEITSNNTAEYSTLVNNKNTSQVEENNNAASFQETMDDYDNKKEDKSATSEINKTSEELLADIISLLKTGMTEDEVESLQKLLRELKEKIKEGEYSEKEIEEMLSGIEKSIQALKQRLLGQVIIEAKQSDSLIKEENANESISTKESDLNNRILDAMNSLEELKSGKIKKDGLEVTINESELLVLIKEFQK